ncbi:hypothetical protein [Wenjunlia tyrosinilytica]|uniref:Uncharacterized protein n=1 Tax=Wenjunlia tyrosinilytica TaxID=1544741 RepID=A0A917ZYY4_9ACTN|nr:hypothetical protein [Wenjunlia tyrosinilytica]GGP00380.1 hypothetical protein GCM10012280_69020 [Wenjunlia tyrosinilytica]
MSTDVAAELRDRLQAEPRDSAGTGFELESLRINFPRKTLAEVILEVRVSPPGMNPELWRVRLPYTGTEARVLAGSPPEETLDYFAFLVRTHLHEWWHTKANEEYSQSLGVRIDISPS